MNMKSEIKPARGVMVVVGLIYVFAKSCIILHLLKADKDKRRHISSEFPSPRTNASGMKANG
jgi:hypothetical protein